MYRFGFGGCAQVVRKQRGVLSMLTVLSVIALTGCGGTTEEADEALSVPTVTVTEMITTTETVTATAFITPSPEHSSGSLQGEADPPADSESNPSGASDDGPTILKPGAARDRDLDLNDLFSSWGQWDQQRLDVASEVDVRALTTEVRSCTADNGSGFELRLANGFEKLSFSAGQANISNSSDRVMKIEVQGNEKQLDTLSVPFNSIVDLSLDVRGVNGLFVVRGEWPVLN